MLRSVDPGQMAVLAAFLCQILGEMLANADPGESAVFAAFLGQNLCQSRSRSVADTRPASAVVFVRRFGVLSVPPLPQPVPCRALPCRAGRLLALVPVSVVMMLPAVGMVVDMLEVVRRRLSPRSQG